MTDLDTAELSVIGAVLLSNGRVLDEIDVAPSDYRHPHMEFIHRTMLAMKADGKPIDTLTVMDAVMKSGEKIDPLILHKAVDVTPSAANAEFYAAMVTDAATKRRVHMATQRIQQMIENGGDADELVEAARKEIDNTQSTARGGQVMFLADTLEQTINYLDSTVSSVPTLWPSMNDLMGGLRPGAVYVVGARPSVGKSVVALQLAQALLKTGSVAFVSLEMSAEDLTTRMISNELRIDGTRLERHTLTASDWSRIGEWTHARRTVPLAILDNTAATITDIKKFARNVHRRQPLAGIVVDYLQLMNASPGDKRPRQEFVSDMSRQLKVLAMDFNVPVIVLSQLNRGSESREDKMPTISDLRESGAIEQDADVVILLHREIIGDQKSNITMAVAKNRRGKTGNSKMDFAGHYSAVIDPLGNI